MKKFLACIVATIATMVCFVGCNFEASTKDADGDGSSSAPKEENTGGSEEKYLTCGITEGVDYEWDEATTTYYVKGIENANPLMAEAEKGGDVVLRILDKYDDGIHGEASVTFLGENCFRYDSRTNNPYYRPVLATITHLILPKSVTGLRPWCCMGMASLEYVYMPGVSYLRDDWNLGGNTLQFRFCNLKGIIIKDLKIQARICFAEGVVEAEYTKIYVLQGGTGIKFIDGWKASNDNLNIVQGKEKGFMQNNSWYFAQDGYTVVEG